MPILEESAELEMEKWELGCKGAQEQLAVSVRLRCLRGDGTGRAVRDKGPGSQTPHDSERPEMGLLAWLHLRTFVTFLA